jgi:hypothetical protein
MGIDHGVGEGPLLAHRPPVMTSIKESYRAEG